ncbi:branched-chain amino acid ABC transporter permease/ATP-binding protein [Phytohabitans sp. ZYX-F-186]|uniref:Branched-chain amino acid ABC transporter permease/ATP-binding protein n=1 Tax=Phytohabitans maris TaxID=3071409 RepID=A0ABU0ZQP2_9ACTN|nr:branched-chain amino acid ABC transporter permease/ATP-binding protein [Phytohabitans sp. ZYX-F-186]MDQ7909343.1 branched-chain amino acid ABC transporter permease/ATP-binding protein [Phytohabitans sp. ZYX-F-186]
MNTILPFIVAGLVTGSVLGLAGTGLVLTYKTSGIFNIGHGAIAAAAAFLFYWLHIEHDWPWWAAGVVAVLLFGPLTGLVMSAVSLKLSGQRAAMKVVATVGIVLLVQGLSTVKFGYNALRPPQFLPGGTRIHRIWGVNVTQSQLIIVAISLVAVAALYYFFRVSRTGLAMRAVVNDPDLVALHGTSPQAVQRLSWSIGATFAALSGVLISPFVGIDAVTMTFLVVSAFGAAAIGGFSSIPLTYLGALAIGVATNLITKYAVDWDQLQGVAAALPLIVLLVALLVIPRRKLDPPARAEQPPKIPYHGPPTTRIVAGVVVLAFLLLAPQIFAGSLTHLTVGLTQAIVLLSLGLLVRTAGMVSLCQAIFAAIGAVTFAQLSERLDLPWVVGVLLAALVVVPVAALLALPAIRLQGLFLALATLGFGLSVEGWLYTKDWFFGTTGTGRPMPRPGGMASGERYYYVVLAFFVVAALVMVMIHQSRLGRMLRGLSEAPLAVRTLGLNANLLRMVVFCIAGYIAGVGGVLYGSTVNYVVLGDGYFAAYYSLVLVATLALMPFREPWYSVVAVVAALIPAYWHSVDSNSWLNVIFGFFAVLIATQGGADTLPRRARDFLDRHFGRKAPAPAVEVADDPWRLPAHATGLEVRDLTIRYGGRTALDEVSLRAPVGQITGLIGPNGAGKTTLFNAASGLLTPSTGQVFLHGNDVTQLNAAARGRRGLGRTFQLMQLADSLTVGQNVALGVESGLAGSNLRGQLVASRAERRATLDAAEYAMELCGIADLRDLPAGALSTGQRRLVELARCLSGPFDLLLLDEPSSGLDSVETARFGQTLVDVVETRRCGILLVEHDMALVLRVSADIYVLDFGKLLFHGTPAQVRNSPVVQAAYLGSETETAEELIEEVVR